MEKALIFASPKEHYIADACIVWCYDARVASLLDVYEQSRGFHEGKVDEVKCAGGAKGLVEAGPDRDYLRDQIAKSIALHGTKLIVLMLHVGCGAYGGSKSFADRDAEWAHHEEAVNQAAEFMRGEFPDATVEICIVDFDGLYQL
jgi:carbonic anhydrase